MVYDFEAFLPLMFNLVQILNVIRKITVFFKGKNISGRIALKTCLERGGEARDVTINIRVGKTGVVREEDILKGTIQLLFEGVPVSAFKRPVIKRLFNTNVGFVKAD